MRKSISMLLVAVMLVLPFGVMMQPKKTHAMGWALPVVDGILRFVVAGAAGQAVADVGGNDSDIQRAIDEAVGFLRYLSGTEKETLARHMLTINAVADATGDYTLKMSNAIADYISPMIANAQMAKVEATDRKNRIEWTKKRGILLGSTYYPWFGEVFGVTLDPAKTDWRYLVYNPTTQKKMLVESISYQTFTSTSVQEVIYRTLIGESYNSQYYDNYRVGYRAEWDRLGGSADDALVVAAQIIFDHGIAIVPKDYVIPDVFPRVGTDVEVRIPLPQLDDVKVYPKDATGLPNTNVPDVVAHPSNGTYVQKETGKVYYPKDVTINVPLPVPVTKSGVTTVVIPANPAVPVDRSITNTKPIDPTVPTNPSTPSKIKWNKLAMAGEIFTTKFPFSIPWDIAKQLSVFDVAPKPPIIPVNLNVPLFNNRMNMNFVIDMTILDGVAVVARWFMVIAFDVGIIMSMRRLMPE